MFNLIFSEKIKKNQMSSAVVVISNLRKLLIQVPCVLDSTDQGATQRKIKALRVLTGRLPEIL